MVPWLMVDSARRLMFKGAVLLTDILSCNLLRRVCSTCPLHSYGQHWLVSVGVTLSTGGFCVMRFSDYDHSPPDLIFTSKLLTPEVLFVQAVATHHPIYTVHAAALDSMGKVHTAYGSASALVTFVREASYGNIRDVVFTCLLPMHGHVYALRSWPDEASNDMVRVTPNLGAPALQTCPHRLWATMSLDGENMFALGQDDIRHLPLLRDWLWVSRQRRFPRFAELCGCWCVRVE